MFQMRRQSHEDCIPLVLMRYLPSLKAIRIIRLVLKILFRNVIYMYTVHVIELSAIVLSFLIKGFFILYGSLSVILVFTCSCMVMVYTLYTVHKPFSFCCEQYCI